MIKKENRNVARLRRHNRVRKSIHGTKECPRLNVFVQIMEFMFK